MCAQLRITLGDGIAGKQNGTEQHRTEKKNTGSIVATKPYLILIDPYLIFSRWANQHRVFHFWQENVGIWHHKYISIIIKYKW